MTIALLTLLHVLIPVYWLGGDLGAFYGSSFLTDPKRTVPERMLALKVLNDIDMAPRTALILALPTGFTLAVAKSWISVPPVVLIGVWLVGLIWLALAWVVHIRHGAHGNWTRTVDLMIRYIVLASLLVFGVGRMIGMVDIPLFLGIKMIALALCISLGLFIRRLLKPLGPAVTAMRTTGSTAETDHAIAEVISNTRPAVILIWVLVLAASYFGIAMPL